MIFRKATEADISAVAEIYEEIHDCEARGECCIGWERGIYPSRSTAEQALGRGDLFVAEIAGEIVGAAIINQIQVDVYAGASWEYPAADSEVTVLHTLVISPKHARKGYGEAFVRFYEQYARESGAPCLRMDTNKRNTRARTLYAKLGFKEIGIVPCTFNGIEGIDLVLLEKRI